MSIYYNDLGKLYRIAGHIGCFESTKYTYGSIAIDNGVIKVYNGKSWEIVKEDCKNDTNTPKKIVPKICSQCGAPIKIDNTTCEYCGTKY